MALSWHTNWNPSLNALNWFSTDLLSTKSAYNSTNSDRFSLFSCTLEPDGFKSQVKTWPKDCKSTWNERSYSDSISPSNDSNLSNPFPRLYNVNNEHMFWPYINRLTGSSCFRSCKPTSTSITFLYNARGKCKSSITLLYTARPSNKPTSLYSRILISSTTGLGLNQHNRDSSLNVNMPYFGSNISRTISWKNSFCTPPSSTPSSPKNWTRNCFLRSWIDFSSNYFDFNACHTNSIIQITCNRVSAMMWSRRISSTK